MKNIYYKNTEGVVAKLSIAAYAALIVGSMSVPDGGEKCTPKGLIEDMVGTIAKGESYQFDSEAMTQTFGAPQIEEIKLVYAQVEEDVAAHGINETAFKAQKEKEKQDKEAEKKAKADAKKAEAAALEKRQDKFIDAGVKGVQKADKDFEKSILDLEKKLPKGISIAANEDGTGYGMAVADGVTEAQLGEAIGYLTRTDENSEYARGAFANFIGDLANAAVASGVYKSMIAAGKALAEKVKELTGREIGGKYIERNARLSSRCPDELRDVSKSPTLYLRVAEAASPKKAKDEEKEAYAKRVAAHEEDRLKLFQSVKDGKITDGKGVDHPVETVKDIAALIEQVQVKHKVIAKPDPNKRSTGHWLRQYYFATAAKENLVGVIEKDVAVFLDDKGTDTLEGNKVTKLTVAQLTDLQEQAKTALETELFTTRNANLSHFIAGKQETERAVLEDGKDGKKVTKKDKDGNVEMETVEVACAFPNPFQK